MTPHEAAEILRQHNLWRRGGDDIEQANPKLIGEAIDVAVKTMSGRGSDGLPLMLSSPEMAPAIAAFNKRVEMDKEFALRVLVRAGITDINGKLTKRYGG